MKDVRLIETLREYNEAKKLVSQYEEEYYKQLRKPNDFWDRFSQIWHDRYKIVELRRRIKHQPFIADTLNKMIARRQLEIKEELKRIYPSLG